MRVKSDMVQICEKPPKIFFWVFKVSWNHGVRFSKKLGKALNGVLTPIFWVWVLFYKGGIPRGVGFRQVMGSPIDLILINQSKEMSVCARSFRTVATMSVMSFCLSPTAILFRVGGLRIIFQNTKP